MSKRSRSSASQSASKAGGNKGPGGKKAETCAQCSKPNKSLKALPCSHAFCPDCLKTMMKQPDQKADKDGRASKMTQRGGSRASAAKKEEYECSVCNPKVYYGDCDPCKFEDKTSPASGFCVECGELLCDTCCTEHNKFKTIRAHNILRDDKIPKDTSAIARLPLLLICTTHTDKDLEYYCADHDVMGCSICINIDHRRCDRVMFIKDIVDEPIDRKAVAEANVDLREIRKNFEDIQRDTGEIVANLEQQRQAIRDKRENYRNRIMEMLDKLDESSEKEMEEVIQRVSKDMGQDAQSSKELLAQIDSSTQILEAAAGHANEKQLFVAGRRSVADRDKYVNLLNKAMGSIQNVNLEFKPGQTLERLTKSLEIFEGRSITSNNVRPNQKSRNTLQPQNDYADPAMSEVMYLSDNVSERLGTARSDTTSRFQNSRADGVLPRIGPNSLMTGSVPDFGSAGYRSSTTSNYQAQFDHRSLPRTPQRYETNVFPQQSQSMPPTPRHAEINRHPLARTASVGPAMYEREPFGQGALPSIAQRGPQSEPGFRINPSSQRIPADFAPASPRSVGTSSVINQGLNRPQPVSKVDILAVNRGPLQRENSLTQKPPSLPAREVSRAVRSDILTQASPIKRRTELSASTPYRERKAVLAGQFNVRLLEDECVCGLKGAAFMQDGRIALADYDNHNVKLFDSKLYRGIQLKLSSGPWDIVVTGPKELAVTLPFESKIQFLSVGDGLKQTRVIKMDMDCYGLVCKNQELIVVCNDYLIGPAVQIVSLTGRVKQTIDVDKSGKRILTDPFYLTVTPTGKLIYVSDKDRIVCMDRHGNVTSIYQEPSLRNARGIDLDPEGNLYVCGYMSNNVHQITMHGIDFRCLVDKNDVYDPWSVKFNASNETLLLTCEGSDTIKVFSLQ